MPGTRLLVRVPGSSANLGPGFDAIGLALNWWDDYEATVTGGDDLVIELAGEGSGGDAIPTDERHLVYATMVRALAELHAPVPRGLRLICRNTLPQGRGLGSSAAAIVAGTALAQGLVAAAGIDPAAGPGAVLEIDRAFTNDLATALEGHPDNASASVYGGLTLSWLDRPSGLVTRNHRHPVRTERIDVHPDIEPVVVVPSFELSTATARAVLPSQVPHREAALNSARAALLVHAMANRPDLLLSATREWLHQEQRRHSLAGAMEVVDALRAAGFGAVISGAGPSILVLTTAACAARVGQCVPAQWTVHRPGVAESGVRVSVLE